jgi:S1-C subfamily serine protease
MEDMETHYVVIDQNRRGYAIDITCWATCPPLDIAVIKAVIPEKPEAIDFRLVRDELKVGDEIKVFCLKDQRLYNQYGRVISASRDSDVIDPTGTVQSRTHDTFLTDAYATPGFSGGVFTTLRGEFAGLVLYMKKNGNDQIGYAGGAKARNVVNLVKRLAHELSNLKD